MPLPTKLLRQRLSTAKPAASLQGVRRRPLPLRRTENGILIVEELGDHGRGIRARDRELAVIRRRRGLLRDRRARCVRVVFDIFIALIANVVVGIAVFVLIVFSTSSSLTSLLVLIVVIILVAVIMQLVSSGFRPSLAQAPNRDLEWESLPTLSRHLDASLGLMARHAQMLARRSIAALLAPFSTSLCAKHGAL